MNDFTGLILAPLRGMYAHISVFFPNVLAMLVIFLAGMFAARVLRAVMLRLLRVIKFDVWSDRMGFTTLLRKGDLWSKPSAAVSSFLFWLLIVVTFLTGLSALHLKVIDGMIMEVMVYLPRIVSAVLILVLGYIATGLIARGLLISLVNSGFPFARQIARAVRLLLTVLLIAMALEQLRVAPQVVVAAFSIIFGGIVLALALSFGIAGVDAAKRMIEQKSERKDQDEARDIQHV